MNKYIKIVISKGRLEKETYKLFEKNGISFKKSNEKDLILTNEIHGIKVLRVKPQDVCYFVNQKYADIGIVGLDWLYENQSPILEHVNLEFGFCKMCLLSNKDLDNINKVKVCTEYTKIAKKYFNEIKKDADIVKLNGSLELTPVENISDCIIDISDTGETAKKMGLFYQQTIFNSNACMTYRKDSDQNITNFIEQIINCKQ